MSNVTTGELVGILSYLYISDILRICSKFNHAEPAPVCNKRKPTTTIDTTLGKTLLEEHDRNMG